MSKILQTDQNELEVCHIFKTQTYEFKIDKDTNHMEKGDKKMEYEMDTVKHSRDGNGNEVFGLTEINKYDSMEKLAKDIVCMGLDSAKTENDGETSYIIKFTVPEFVGETEVLSKNKVIIRGGLEDEERGELREEILVYLVELNKKKSSKQTK